MALVHFNIKYFVFCLEWVEFTPFEYGMAKYGVFGKIEEFGGKFYKGSLVKKFEEPPLSYLQGNFTETDVSNCQEVLENPGFLLKNP